MSVTLNVQTDLVVPALDLVKILTDSSIPGSEKLNKVTDEITKVGEGLDNFVSLVPTVGDFAAWVVDLPPVDNFEKEYIFKPIAEVIYQGYAYLSGAVQNLSQFAKGIVEPLVGLLHSLADSALDAPSKWAALKAKALELLGGLGKVVEFFPGGLRQIAEWALASGEAQKWLTGLAEIVATFLDKVFSVFTGKPAVTA